ncbi:MAG TPA: LolA-related protein [Steroidobacteraceae bacterium]|jgi:outer membrane lipoprotein-sorting protein
MKVPKALRCAVALLCLASATAWSAAGVEGESLGQLMALLAQRRQGSADFEQTQYLSALKQPQHSSGVLTYQAPDHLEEHTLKPHEQSMVLDHGMLTLTSGKRRRTLRLQDYPEIAPLIDSIRATLAGDRAALEQRFELSFQGTLDRWQLLLTPRDAHLAATVQRIRIGGQRDAILEVEVQQSDGDHSLMTIKPRE